MRSLLILLLLMTPSGWAQSDLELYQSANEAYLKGAYSKAADGYRQYLESHGPSGVVYYNLGNAYYQLEDWGRARVAFEKARRLRPRDSDLEYNLALLATELKDQQPQEPTLPRLALSFTRNELALAGALGYWLACGLGLAYTRQKREPLAWGAIFAALFMVGCFSLLAVRELGAVSRQAVVIPSMVQVKNGPGRDFTNSLQLHTGTQVEVLREKGDWLEVLALARVQGWVRREELMRL